MATADTSANSSIAVPREYAPFAAFLSYLVPGLGQIYQGRFAKGLLFMVCLLGLFFYGMKLGSWNNVYLPHTAERSNPWNLPIPLANVANRLPFAGQFWIGAAAWPAILQYSGKWPVTKEQSPFWHSFQTTPPETRADAKPGWDGKTLNELQADGDKTWDLGWVYTVIAGVLNILVIYDAFAGPAFIPHEPTPSPREEPALT